MYRASKTSSLAITLLGLWCVSTVLADVNELQFLRDLQPPAEHEGRSLGSSEDDLIYLPPRLMADIYLPPVNTYVPPARVAAPEARNLNLDEEAQPTTIAVEPSNIVTTEIAPAETTIEVVTEVTEVQAAAGRALAFEKEEEPVEVVEAEPKEGVIQGRNIVYEPELRYVPPPQAAKGYFYQKPKKPLVYTI